MGRTALHLTDFDAATTWISSGRAVITVRGELDLATAPRLEALLDDLRATGSVAELDLRGVTFVDCAAWRLVRPYVTGPTAIPRVRTSEAVERLRALLALAAARRLAERPAGGSDRKGRP